MIPRKIVGGGLALLALCTLGCNPEKLVDEYFRRLGLNRLVILRTDIQPGAYIVGKKKTFVYSDNMMDYLTGEKSSEIPVIGGDATSTYNAVLNQHEGEEEIAPALALSFIAKVLPIDLEGKLSFTSKVKISIAQVKVRRLKIPALRKFLQSSNSRPFRDDVWQQFEAKHRAYVAYETYRAKKLLIEASGGSEVTAGIEVGKSKVFTGANAKVTVTRKSKSKLELDGDTYYVFAVRTARLTKGENGAVEIDQVDFKVPAEWGIKAVGTDDAYSVALDQGAAAVTLVDSGG